MRKVMMCLIVCILAIPCFLCITSTAHTKIKSTEPTCEFGNTRSDSAYDSCGAMPYRVKTSVVLSTTPFLGAQGQPKGSSTYYPDDTIAVLIVDVEKTLRSKPVQQILGKKNLIEFLRDVDGKGLANLFLTPQVESVYMKLGEKLIASTDRISMVVSKQDQSESILVFLEGSYDVDELQRGFKAAVRAAKQPFRMKTIGNHELYTVWVAEKNSLWGTAIGTSVLAIGDRALLEATISRAQGKTRPNMNNDMKAALKELPRNKSVVAAFRKVNANSEEPEIVTSELDLGEKRIRMAGVLSFDLVDDAKKFALETLPAFLEMANAILGGEPIAKHLKGAKIDRSGKRVTIEIAAPSEVVIAWLKPLLNPNSQLFADERLSSPGLAPTFELKGLKCNPVAIAFSRDRKLLAATTPSSGGGSTPEQGTPGQFIVWDLASRKPILEQSLGFDLGFNGAKKPIDGNAIAFHPDNHLLAVSTPASWRGETVIIWDIGQKKEVQRVPGTFGAFSPSGDYLAVNYSSYTVSQRINLVDTQTWKTARSLLLPDSSRFISLAYSPDGNMIAALYANHPSAEELKVKEKQPDTLAIWKTTGGRPIETIQVKDSKGIAQFAWSPDGTKLAFATNYDSVRIWDRNKQMEIRKYDLKNVQGLAFRPDGKQLAAAMLSGVYKVLDLQSNEQFTFQAKTINSSILDNGCVAFSPDGQFLTGGSGSGVYFWLLK